MSTTAANLVQQMLSFCLECPVSNNQRQLSLRQPLYVCMCCECAFPFELYVQGTSGIHHLHLGGTVPSGWSQYCVAEQRTQLSTRSTIQGVCLGQPVYAVIMPGSASLGLEQINHAPFCCMYISCKMQLFSLSRILASEQNRTISMLQQVLRLPIGLIAQPSGIHIIKGYETLFFFLFFFFFSRLGH